MYKVETLEDRTGAMPLPALDRLPGSQWNHVADYSTKDGERDALEGACRHAQRIRDNTEAIGLVVRVREVTGTGQNRQSSTVYIAQRLGWREKKKHGQRGRAKAAA